MFDFFFFFTSQLQSTGVLQSKQCTINHCEQTEATGSDRHRLDHLLIAFREDVAEKTMLRTLPVGRVIRRLRKKKNKKDRKEKE